MTEFERINAKRVPKLRKALSVIYQSACSNKSTGEFIDLIEPLLADLRKHDLRIEPKNTPGLTIADVVTDDLRQNDKQVEPRQTILTTPHIEQIGAFVDGLPAKQLPTFVTHILNRMCETFETREREDR